MKRKTLGLIHTSATLVPVFAHLCKDKLPGVDVFNIADDSLVKDIIARRRSDANDRRRVAGHICNRPNRRARITFMVTCSSIGRAVEGGAGRRCVPVLRVDQPMADQAVATGETKSASIATLPTTLEPTADSDSTARGKGREENHTDRRGCAKARSTH